MIRRPPRSTQGVSSAASDVYKRQVRIRRLYDLAQTYVFSKQSPPPFLCGFSGLDRVNRFTLKSTPSSEGTGLFCRVPWPEFSRAPWIIHPTHLSWFPVRFACPILRSFSRQHRLNNFRPFGHGLVSQDREERICQLFIPTRLHRDNQRPACLSSCVPSSREHTST